MKSIADDYVLSNVIRDVKDIEDKYVQASHDVDLIDRYIIDKISQTSLNDWQEYLKFKK